MQTDKIDHELFGIWLDELQARLNWQRAKIGTAAANAALACQDLSAALVMAYGDQPFDDDGEFLAPLAASYDGAQAAAVELKRIVSGPA